MLQGNRVLYRGLMWIAGVALAAAMILGQGIETMRVSYVLFTESPTVSEPVFVRFSIENRLPEALVTDVGVNANGYGAFRARLTRPDGRVEQGPPPSVHELVPKQKVVIPPFASYSTQLLVSKWFEFDIPGRYVIDLESVRPFTTADGITKANGTTGRVILDVRPGNPNRLLQVCADLERTALSARGSAETLAAVEALSRINDPIAVPFLARLLQANDRLVEVIKALERISDRPAIEVLFSFSASPSADTRELVQAALTRIENRTTDPAIKQRIQESRERGWQ